ncbi:MAG: YigZ family protein [Candidatus Hydrogenedentales bacterium]
MINETFPVPLGPARAEIVVVNSRFIASLDYVETVDEARSFMASIRREFSDATHNVPAFIVGGGNSSTEFCSDDGEPSGTSGRPLLSVLRGSGLGNVAVVVTRYFGGTLLGTGGLVKAYSEAGKKVLEQTDRALLTELTTLRIELPYAHFDGLRMILPRFKASIASEVFTESVRIEVDVPSDEVARFLSTLADLSSGVARTISLGSRTARLAL